MLYQELTGKILEACFEVSNELGSGFLESVYEKALLVALRQKGLNAESQIPIEVIFRDALVGEFYADILVENKVLLELKAVSGLSKEHFAQIINYLKATKVEVGMIVNFGTAKIEYRRFDNRFLQAENNENLSLISNLLESNLDNS